MIDSSLGVYVPRSTYARRQLVWAAGLHAAYCGLDEWVNPDEEAYLSSFRFGDEMREHLYANRGSVKAYDGPVGGTTLVIDIDRRDPAQALNDTRRLVLTLLDRYPELDGVLPIFFSGRKGYHVEVELTHRPRPFRNFNSTCKALATMLGEWATVSIDEDIYDKNRLMRLPNSRHPESGLFKVLLEPRELFALDLRRLHERAQQPFAFDFPVCATVIPRLEEDWNWAERVASERAKCAVTLRSAKRPDNNPGEGVDGFPRAPKYLMEFIRFGVEEGARATTLFKCAAWLAESGVPAGTVFALLDEPARDCGLSPSEIVRQITCGIEHVHKRTVGDPNNDD